MNWRRSVAQSLPVKLETRHLFTRLARKSTSIDSTFSTSRRSEASKVPQSERGCWNTNPNQSTQGLQSLRTYSGTAVSWYTKLFLVVSMLFIIYKYDISFGLEYGNPRHFFRGHAIISFSSFRSVPAIFACIAVAFRSRFLVKRPPRSLRIPPAL
ncbi:unnamed protein product [Cyclocybe aegerita]|uniref:Uncharacterized protein n=1 Tax=Cyclocybe aegerita TaxID=1973307 RepID=A0A8S0X9I1_CYCAE|nr:unnamed protein product [Cyclocybe aegerita]